MPPKKIKKEIKEEVKENIKKEVKEITPEITSESSDDTKISTASKIYDEKTYFDASKYPLCYKINKSKANKSIFDTEINVLFSDNMEFPSFEYGFHHFIHQCKNYLNLETKKFEGKKKVWNVMNRFEPNIDNYTQSISDLSNKYFSEISKIEIVSSSFYKTWELYSYFDIIDAKKDTFISAHLFDGLGNFSQSLIYYRDMFSKKNKDKCYLIEDEKVKSVVNVKLDKKFVDHYEKDKKIIIDKISNIKQKCDLVTCDGGFGELNENLQEKEAPRLLIYELLSCIKILKKGGTFICKFFETFTKTTLKIIIMLTELFGEVTIIKPLASKLSSTERYVVCENFRYSDGDKEYKNIVSFLTSLYEKMNKKSDNVVNILMNYDINQDLEPVIKNENITFSNVHFEHVNKIVKFIRNQVYSGEDYHENRDAQIEGAKYWTDLFLYDDLNKNKTKKLLQEATRFLEK